MNIFKYILLFSGLFLLNTCQNKESAGSAHFRALTMVQYPSVTLTIQGKGTQKSVHKTFSIGYAEPIDYQLLTPGHYEITLSVKGKELLKSDYVLGKNGYYTLLAAGLLPEKWKVNPRTTMYQLKYIFAGEELESTNSYLPQWFMMRDNYDGSKESAYIRLVNANPCTSTLTIKKDGKSLKSGIAYPVESGMLKLEPGAHRLQAFYGEVSLGSKKINPKPGYIYTGVIGGKSNSSGDLTISVLENPSRTLLESK